MPGIHIGNVHDTFHEPVTESARQGLSDPAGVGSGPAGASAQSVPIAPGRPSTGSALATGSGALRDIGYRIGASDRFLSGARLISTRSGAVDGSRTPLQGGLRGAGWSEADKARARAALHEKAQATRTELEAKRAEGNAKRDELNNTRVAKTGAESRISALDQRKDEAKRRFEEASSRAGDYERKAGQAARHHEEAKRRHDAANATSSTQRADTPSELQHLFSNQAGSKLQSAFNDESVVHEARDEQRRYEDSHREWSGKRDEARRDLSKIEAELGDAWRDKVHMEDKASKLELEFASLESERLRHERQLADLEREQARIDSM
ncbi:hypothetical protein [Paraburkholderia sp. SOS3]|uniref:hypothetical protein n=1 Tax=Paraburkholderia sp. SOS3 TaxID=1926494 RepID=UPI0012EC196D|nr:hypothetical protein [Paraburkholderia sp. SOS3]